MNSVEITDLSRQLYRLYLENSVDIDINNKITTNFSSTNQEVRERATLLFRLVNETLFNIANGNFDEDNQISQNEFYMDVIDGTANCIATILFELIYDDNNEEGIYVTRIVWKTMAYPWWNIILEHKRKVITESQLRRIIREAIRKIIA